MKRLVIMTVGKTHSGKTTFAKALEQQLHNSVVIDQDNHAEFINTYYKALQPKKGPNMLKFAISQKIVDYAVSLTDYHLILCNSNRIHKGRLDLLSYFHSNGFTSVLVNFEIPDHVLQERVANSQRSTTVFRSASSFEEVLVRQQAESHKSEMTAPIESEANHFFVIKDADDVQSVTQRIVNIAQSL